MSFFSDFFSFMGYLFLISIGSLAFVYWVKYLIKNGDQCNVDDNVILRTLSMSQLHFIFVFIIYLMIQNIDPMAADRGINAILDETFIGDIVGFFTDVNTEPNYYAIAIANEMKRSSNIFLFITIIICLIESLGLINKFINRWFIESLSIICTISTYLYQYKIRNFQEEIVAQSKLEGIANYFGESFVDAFSFTGPLLYICFFALIINHILYHKALNKYYNDASKPSKNHLICIALGGGALLFLFNKFILNPDIIINETASNIEQIEYKTTPNANINTNTVSPSRVKFNQIKTDSDKLVLYTNTSETYVYYLEKDGNDYFKNVIYKYDIEDESIKEIKCDEILCTDSTTVNIFPSFSDVIIHNDIIVLIGSNGWSGFGYTNYGLRFTPESETFTVLFSCNSDIERNGRIFRLLQRDMLSLGEYSSENDYYYYNEFYDIYGNKIDGFSVYGDGKIDKYPIRMFFHSEKDSISGWYRYEGHDNYMTIKGKLYEDRFIFTEYDANNNAFANFTGNVDFEKQLLTGTFNRDNKKLNFWVYNESDLRSCIEAWNYIHTPQLGNCAKYTNLYGESVLFYGETFTPEQCVEHFVKLINKYNSYSQKIVSEIRYTSIDSNTVQCDFVKGVEFNGKYKEYESYLIFHRKNEYSSWKIITESDKTTDYNLNKRKNKK